MTPCCRVSDLLVATVRHPRCAGTPSEEADPKVTEFLRILEEYRIKCESEGNYLEAGRASEQLGTLRKQVRCVFMLGREFLEVAAVRSAFVKGCGIRILLPVLGASVRLPGHWCHRCDRTR